MLLVGNYEEPAAADGVLRLVEQPAETKKDQETKDPLSFYIRGSRVLSGLLSVMFLRRKKLFN